MRRPAVRFDADSVRESWNAAADAYAGAQAAGKDHYRSLCFGPAQVAVCGPVDGLHVLDVGCGSGYFAREMARRGARVTAVDLSPRMIEHARRVEEKEALGIEYHIRDAATLADGFTEAPFDMATSCVALSDMPEPARVLRGVHSLLRPGARFVASITHPCTDTPFRRWERETSGRKKWLCIDDYFQQCPLEYNWRGWAYDFTTPWLHATLEDWFGWIVAAGFQVRGLREPRPSEEGLAAHPELEDAARVPFFLILDLAASDV